MRLGAAHWKDVLSLYERRAVTKVVGSLFITAPGADARKRRHLGHRKIKAVQNERRCVEAQKRRRAEDQGSCQETGGY